LFRLPPAQGRSQLRSGAACALTASRAKALPLFRLPPAQGRSQLRSGAACALTASQGFALPSGSWIPVIYHRKTEGEIVILLRTDMGTTPQFFGQTEKQLPSKGSQGVRVYY